MTPAQQLCYDCVSDGFDAALATASWVTRGSIQAAKDKALLPENITKEVQDLAVRLAKNGLQLATLALVPVPCA